MKEDKLRNFLKYLQEKVQDCYKEECAIYAEYTATKEDCDFIGQVDLREAYQKMKEE